MLLTDAVCLVSQEGHQQQLSSIKVHVASHFAVGLLHCTKPRRVPPHIPSGFYFPLQGLALPRCSCTSPQRPHPLPSWFVVGAVRAEVMFFCFLQLRSPAPHCCLRRCVFAVHQAQMVVPSRFHKLNGRCFFLKGPVPPAPLTLVSRLLCDRQSSLGCFAAFCSRSSSLQLPGSAHCRHWPFNRNVSICLKE